MKNQTQNDASMTLLNGSINNKDSWFFLASVACCAAVVASTLLVAPLIAGQLIGDRGLTGQQAGMAISAELAGISMASFPALYWLSRISWHRVLYFSLCVLIIGNLVSTSIETYNALLITRFITALAGGSIILITMQAAGRARNPEFAYSCWLIGQLVFGAIALVLLPSLFAKYQLNVFYFLIAGLCAACILVVKGLPNAATELADKSDSDKRIPLAGFVGLAGIFLFYISIGGVWTYVERLGTAISFDAQSIGTILGLATVAGILGAAVSSSLNKFFGSVNGIILGTGLLVLAILIFRLADSQFAYIASAVVFKFTWTFTIPFVLAAMARLDDRGALITSCNVLIGAGIAVGPIIAASMIKAGPNYSDMLSVMFCIALLASLSLIYSVAKSVKK